MSAWASTTWAWYWATFSWAGVAFAFLVALLILSVVFLFFAIAISWLRGRGRIPETKTPNATDDHRTKDKYLKSAFVYGGSRNPYQRPWFSAKFTRRGKVARIYLDHSHYVGHWGIDWSNRTRIFLREIGNFVPDQGIRIELLSEYKRGANTLWRWGCEETEPPHGDYAFLADSPHRGRVVVICDDAPEEHSYFKVLQPSEDIRKALGEDAGKVTVPQVVGHWMFNFVEEWEAEP